MEILHYVEIGGETATVPSPFHYGVYRVMIENLWLDFQECRSTSREDTAYEYYSFHRFCCYNGEYIESLFLQTRFR